MEGNLTLKQPNKRNPFLNEEVIINVTHSSCDSQPIREDQEDILIKALNLSTFKTQPCEKTNRHNHKRCAFYHSSSDKRRVGSDYTPRMCKMITDNNDECPNKDECKSAHNLVEINYHPEIYKRKYCQKFMGISKKCEYGEYCPSAHSEIELSSELIHHYIFDDDFFLFHFKTIICPFISCKDEDCVYAHNWSEFRRKPQNIDYEPIMCPLATIKVNDSEAISENIYEQDYFPECPASDKCNKCHSKNEQEFHPLYYRIHPCNDTECLGELQCTGYHSLPEKREIDERILSGLMRYMPKNRIVLNTFKHQEPDRKEHSNNSHNSTAKSDSKRHKSSLEPKPTFGLQRDILFGEENDLLKKLDLSNQKPTLQGRLNNKSKAFVPDDSKEKKQLTSTPHVQAHVISKSLLDDLASTNFKPPIQPPEKLVQLKPVNTNHLLFELSSDLSYQKGGFQERQQSERRQDFDADDRGDKFMLHPKTWQVKDQLYAPVDKEKEKRSRSMNNKEELPLFSLHDSFPPEELHGKSSEGLLNEVSRFTLGNDLSSHSNYRYLDNDDELDNYYRGHKGERSQDSYLGMFFGKRDNIVIDNSQELDNKLEDLVSNLIED